MKNLDESGQIRAGGAPAPYEPPRVEEVLGPEDLTREVHYAGIVVSGNPG